MRAGPPCVSGRDGRRPRGGRATVGVAWQRGQRSATQAPRFAYRAKSQKASIREVAKALIETIYVFCSIGERGVAEGEWRDGRIWRGGEAS